MKKNHQNIARTWQESKWSQVLAILLGVVPAYLMPLYFTTREEQAVFDPGSVLFYSIFWGGAMSLIILLVLRFLNGERIKENHMRFRIIIILLIILVSVSGCFSKSLRALPEEELQLVLDQSREEGGLIGVSATIIDGQGNLWTGVSGDSHPGQSITPDMVFDMGSAGKMLAAALMLDLSEEGLIELDNSIETYIEPPPGVDGSIPIRSLLNHTSGLANVVDHPNSPFRKPYRLIEYDRWWEIDEIFTELGSEPHFQPGDGWHYSQAGYQIATLIIEEVTGLSTAENIQSRLLDPLGIQGMVLDFTQPLPEGTTVAHNWVALNNHGKPTDVYDRSRNWIASISRILFYTTSEDFARWGQALFSGEVLEAESLNEMLDFVEITDYGSEPPIFSGYGLGVLEWIPEMLNGLHGYGHSGSIPGYRAFLAYLPEYDLTIAVMSNSDHEEELGILVNDLLAVALGQTQEEKEIVYLDLDPMSMPPAEVAVVEAFLDPSLFCGGNTSWQVGARSDQWIDLSLDWVVATTPDLAKEVWEFHNHRITINGNELNDLETFQHPVINYQVDCPDSSLDLYARGLSIYLPPFAPGEYEIVWRSDVTGDFYNGFVEYKEGNYLEARAFLSITEE